MVFVEFDAWLAREGREKLFSITDRKVVSLTYVFDVIAFKRSPEDIKWDLLMAVCFRYKCINLFNVMTFIMDKGSIEQCQQLIDGVDEDIKGNVLNASCWYAKEREQAGLCSFFLEKGASGLVDDQRLAYEQLKSLGLYKEGAYVEGYQRETRPVRRLGLTFA